MISLIGINFENFKSLEKCGVDFKENITGIYGENGIGKTTVVDAIELLKEECMLSIEHYTKEMHISEDSNDSIKKLLSKYKQYCKKDTKNMKLEYIFAIDNYIYTYSKEVFFELSDFSKYIETISYYNINRKSKIHSVFSRAVEKSDSKSMFQYTLFENSYSLDFDQLTTDDFVLLSSIASDVPYFIEEKIDESKLKQKQNQHICNIKKIIKYILNTSIVKLSDQSLIDLGICIPVNIHLRNKEYEVHGKIPIRQFNTYYSEQEVNSIKANFGIVNSFLKSLLSEREIVVCVYDIRRDENTNDLLVAIEIDVKQPDGKLVNIENESTGIIKLISILSAFTELVVNDSYLLVIDELDSHVYEYLLSVLINQLNTNIKGKLIFTSHNLTLFENLDAQNFVIIQRNSSTSKNEFVKLRRPSKTANMRSQYLRALYLGNDDICPVEIDENRVFRAFRSARRGHSYE